MLRAVDAIEEDSLGFEASKDLLVELMTGLHGELGHRVLLSWNLPEELAVVARDHHGSDDAADALMLCVQAANLITCKLGFHLDPDETITLVGHPVMEELGLDDLTIATMMIDMEDHLAEMKAML